jgi:tetratricopeptide (TPR) repeat protein
LKRLTLLLLPLLIVSQLSSLQLVDGYIEQGEVDKALNRLFNISKDERNFTCLDLMPCVTVEDIDKRIEALKNRSRDPREREIISNFFNELGMDDNNFVVAYRLKKEKRYFEAYDRYKSLSAMYPRNINLMENLGVTALKTDKLREAEIIYKELIRVDPENGENYIQLAGIYYKNGKFDKAKKVLKEAKRVNPSDERVPQLEKEIDNSTGFVAQIFDNKDSKKVEKIVNEKDPVSGEGKVIPAPMPVEFEEPQKPVPVQFEEPQQFPSSESEQWDGKLDEKSGIIMLPPMEEEKRSLMEIKTTDEEYDATEKELEQQQVDTEKMLEEKREEREKEKPKGLESNRTVKFVAEINRVLDDTISNFKDSPFIVSENLFAIDEITSVNFETSYITPNIYLQAPLFSSIDLGLNFHTKQYMEAKENQNYTLVSPFVNYTFSSDLTFGFVLNYLVMDKYRIPNSTESSESVISPTLYVNYEFMEALFKMIYKINSYDQSDLSHDSLRFSGEYSLKKFLLNDELRLKYSMVKSSLLSSSSDNFKDISQYFSNILALNYLLSPIENVEIEAGMSYEGRTYSGTREDSITTLIAMVQYILWKNHKLSLIIKSRTNSSNIDSWDYDETVFGFNYKYLF